MSKNIVIVGFGPGVSTSVAEVFGAQGFSVAIVGRNSERLDAAVNALVAKGIRAGAFVADASQPKDVQSAIRKAREQFGAITVVHWNTIGGLDAGDLLAVDPASLGGIFDTAIVGLVAAVQEVLPDLRGTKDGAILVTNGGFAELNPLVDQYAVGSGSAGVALSNAAKHKLVGLLVQQLKPDDVYVGEVMIAGSVRPAGSDNGIDPAIVGQKFWELYQARNEPYGRVS